MSGTQYLSNFGSEAMGTETVFAVIKLLGNQATLLFVINDLDKRAIEIARNNRRTWIDEPYKLQDDNAYSENAVS